MLSKQLVEATQTVARQLALTAGAPVVRIQRVRLADNVPLSFDETYLPRDIGEKIIENDLETEPIFSLLEQKYHVPLVEAEYRLEAVAADATAAHALGIPSGSPIFRIERTSIVPATTRSTTRRSTTVAIRFASSPASPDARSS